MTDARKLLEDYHSYSSGADSAAGARLHMTTAALLAVLDECNRIDHDAEQMLYQFGPGDYYEGLMMGLTTSASNVRRAINAALGVQS